MTTLGATVSTTSIPTAAAVSGLYVPLAAPVNKLSLGPGTINCAFTDLDLSSAVPAGALAACIGLRYRDTASTVVIQLRCNGVTTGGQIGDGTLFYGNMVISSYQYHNLIVPVDANRIIEYKITSGSAVTDIYIDVQGYFAGPLA